MIFRVAIVITAALAGSVHLARAEEKATRASNFEASIRAATNIVFRQWKFDGKGMTVERFTVSDPGQVRQLTSSIHLGTEMRNGSEFLLQADFEGPSGIVKVQFSRRFFVVVDPPSSKGYVDHTYEMPDGFYAQFEELARGQPWKTEKP